MTDATLIFTVGHSNRPLPELLDMLSDNRIELLVDIRIAPRSRHNPQFDADALAEELRRRSIDYLHIPGLGGLRRPLRDSANTGWLNVSFRGFADHMQTEEFEKALERLIRLSGGRRVAIMCAEAVPWRCHRSLVADALVARGLEVEHLIGRRDARRHALTRFAVVERGRVRYPGGMDQMDRH